MHWKKSQAGHYVSRKYLGTFVNEFNVKPQCAGCNLYKKGASDEFAFHLVQEQGAIILDYLNTLKHENIKPDTTYYQNLIDEYINKLKTLNK